MEINRSFWVVGRRKRKKKKAVRPVVIKVVPRQIGETTITKDKKLKAMKPGKRKSRSGKIYYEYRANRSDLKKGI